MSSDVPHAKQEPPSRFIAFFDECGDHSLTKIDPDFPLFLLALVVVEREVYLNSILPALNAFKLGFFDHEGINLHSRDIRLNSGPFRILRHPGIRAKFLPELAAVMESASFTLFISVIMKQPHLDRSGPDAANPYDLSLEFTMEHLVHFLEMHGETRLPIVAEARGRQEDNNLEKTFFRVLSQGTKRRPADDFKRLSLSLTFQPKVNNIVGVQLADLCAHPCARFLLNPQKENQAFNVVRHKIYAWEEVTGWRIFPE